MELMTPPTLSSSLCLILNVANTCHCVQKLPSKSLLGRQRFPIFSSYSSFLCITHNYIFSIKSGAKFPLTLHMSPLYPMHLILPPYFGRKDPRSCAVLPSLPRLILFWGNNRRKPKNRLCSQNKLPRYANYMYHSSPTWISLQFVSEEG